MRRHLFKNFVAFHLTLCRRESKLTIRSVYAKGLEIRNGGKFSELEDIYDIDDNGKIIFRCILCSFHSTKLINFYVYYDIRPLKS